MAESKIDKKMQEYFRQIAANATALVEPFVVGIYALRDDPKDGVEQVGTGFSVRHEGGTALVTAKHTLYGENFDENPGDKLIFSRGALTPLGDLGKGEVCKSDAHWLDSGIPVERFCFTPNSCGLCGIFTRRSMMRLVSSIWFGDLCHG